MEKFLEKIFPWGVSLVVLLMLAWTGYGRWEMGDTKTASLIWIMILPLGLVLFTLIWTQQAIERACEKEDKKDNQVDHN